jgi:hypothetical protein
MAGKRWTFKEDLFLHEFFDAIGDYVGTHDLGRPRGAATKRVAFLRATGAWAALDRRKAAEADYRHCLGNYSADEITVDALSPLTHSDLVPGSVA